jgi:D-glycero-D-manno-heptose 1,7-bisphosphate phosphatase
MRLLLVDRDGVVLRHVDPYILSWDDVAYAEGAIARLAEASRRGFAPFVVTNQSPISRGLVEPGFVDQVNASIAADVAAAGGRIFGFRVCPHSADDACRCRKPKTAMLEDAARQTRLPLRDAWLVGDSAEDIGAGRSASVARLFHVCGGRDRSVCGAEDVTCIGRLADLPL